MSEDIKSTQEAPAAQEGTNAAPQRTDNRDNRGERPQRGGRRVPRFKKKVCKFCHNKELVIDYKRSDILMRFITDRGKILPRRITGTCAKHQRRVAAEIKRARTIALLPFVEQ
jgi:small subunit ribosomal protein S18